MGNGGGLYNSSANYSFNAAPDFVAKIALSRAGATGKSSASAASSATASIPQLAASQLYLVHRTWNDTIPAAAASAAASADRSRQKGHHRPQGPVGPGRGPLRLLTIADVTVRPNGSLAPLQAFSALSTIEFNPTKRLNIYFNYGGDYIYREYVAGATTAEGYGIPGCLPTPMSGCNTEAPAGTSDSRRLTAGNPSAPSNCKANNKDVQEFTFGYWYNVYAGPKGRLR